MRTFLYLILLSLVSFTAFLGCAKVNKAVETSSPQVADDDTSAYHIRLVASGHSPEWKVFLTDSHLVYAHIGLEQRIKFTNAKLISTDTNNVRYAAKNENGVEIKLQLTKEKCQDAMNERILPYSVSLELNNGMEEALQGCGMYEEDERLHGTWNIISMNGKPIKGKNREKAPQLVFDSKNNAIGANFGCNSMGGTYTLFENILFAGPNFTSTLLYCEDIIRQEDTFTAIWVGHEISYTFINKHLILTNEKGTEVLDCIRL